MSDAPPPKPYHSVTPRIVVADVEGQVDFLRAVFNASGEIVEGRPVEVVIGDSIVMVTSAESREPFPGFMYMYVPDADETYGRADRFRRRSRRATARHAIWGSAGNGPRSVRQRLSDCTSDRLLSRALTSITRISAHLRPR